MQNHRLIKMGQYLDDTETPDPRTFIQSLPRSQSIIPSHIKQTDSKHQINDLLHHLSKSKDNHRNKVHFQDEVQEIHKQQHKTSERDPYSESDSLQDQPTLNRLTSAANILTSNNKISLKLKKKTRHDLKEIISRQKVQILRDKFIDKIKRNNIFAPPVDFLGFDAGSSDESFLNSDGFGIIPIIDNGLTLLSVIQITFLLLAYSLAIVFAQIAQVESVTSLQMFSLFFYLIEIGYNCVTVKTASGKKMSKLSQILQHYWQTNLPIDIVSLLILVIDVSSSFIAMKYVRLFILAKLPQCLDKIEKLEVFFIKNYYNEQYWSLIKVFLFNFCFAHVLAILLTAIANIDQNTNWQIVRGIRNSWWFERYVWAYYWGTNIMLTVGFGDIVATTYQQAICLVFIEMVSVICLAYNINWLGTLISNIRTQDRQKSRNMKMFKQLSDKYQLPDDLEWRINNYIEESVNIRKKFNLEQENAFISTLPPNLRKDYLQESNRSIFHDLTFFGNLVDRTLVSFAQKIEMLISHPEQTLRHIDDDYNLLILRQGEIGYVTKRRNCKFSDIMIMDRLKVHSHQKPSLLGLQFISRSTQYSVMYFMPFEQLLSILNESHMDYLHYCYLRDRNKTTIDQFEVFVCQFCDSRHTKFNCPKLHFMPIQQHVIHRAQHNDRISTNSRNNNNDLRIQEPYLNTLKNFKKMSKLMKNFNKQKGNKMKAQIKILDSFRQKAKFKNETSMLEPAHDEMVEYFMKNTSEVIKQEFNRFSRTENYEDEVWIIHCDKMKNYKEYFQNHNASNLEENFKVETRMERKKHNKIPTTTMLKSYQPPKIPSLKQWHECIDMHQQ